MFKNGKLFGLVNPIDIGIVFFVLIALIGLFLVKSGKFTTSANMIKKEGRIVFDVVIRGQKLSKNEDVFIKGEKSFISIRNVPYTSLEIINSERSAWQTITPDPKNPSKVIAVTDPTAPYTYNFLVTLKDKATITDDGPVIGGNKIKIGLPITLEGFKYRFSGIVSDVRIVK